jgi:hypothetical protein
MIGRALFSGRERRERTKETRVSSVVRDERMYALDEDDLVVLVDTVLVDPVRVQAGIISACPDTLPHHSIRTNSHSQVSTPLSNSLLGSAPQTSLVLQVVDTLSDGFTVGGTLGSRLLPVSSANTDTVDEVALLGLVPQTTSLVGSRRAGCTVADGELTVLPASDTGDELKNVRLLFGVKFGQVFVGTHLRVSVQAMR